jgi:hypothetical protein
MTGLGRRYAPDPRDAAYRISKAIPQLETTRNYRYWNTSGAWFDQGSTSTCVGHAWAHWFEDGPVTQTGTTDPMAIYDDATLIDEWQGNERDRDFGTSIRAGAEVLRARGAISVYSWAMSWEELDFALLELGPVVIGIDWFTDMFDGDVNGFIHPTGSLAGGHAIKIDGRNRAQKKWRLKNSWGRGWNDDGFCWLHDEDLDYLIFGLNGEACLATEIRL